MEIKRDAYPALFEVADASSVSGQRAYRWLVQIELALILGSAALGAGAVFLPDLQRPLAWLASAALIGAIAIKLFNRQSGADQRWFDGRAVAETVKTQAWRYMMRLSPYDSDATADDVFSADVLSTLRASPGLQQSVDALPDDPRQISDVMRRTRGRDLAQRTQLYVIERLNEQAGWYRQRARRAQSKGARWFWVSLVAQLVAAGIAFYSIGELADARIASLIGFFAALAAAATAWTQLGRHDELSKAYGLAYQELITIRDLADRVATESQLEQLVTMAEAAISREHTMWMARVAPVGRLGGGGRAP